MIIHWDEIEGKEIRPEMRPEMYDIKDRPFAEVCIQEINRLKSFIANIEYIMSKFKKEK